MGRYIDGQSNENFISTGEIIDSRYKNSPYLKDIDNNIDNKKDNLNIDNSIDKGKYAYKESFELRSEETALAHEIASFFNELNNYALYRSVIQKLGCQKARRLLSETKDDIRRERKKGKPIKNPAALFNWKAKRLAWKLKKGV